MSISGGGGRVNKGEGEAWEKIEGGRGMDDDVHELLHLFS